ncbi:MAG TPA: histidine kinase, partial [Steroidobacteraceae bacterium]
MALEPAPDGVMWVGGDHGLQRFDGQRFVSLPTAADREFKSISGIKQLANGDVWMNTNAGAVRIPAVEIRQLLKHATTHIDYELLNHLDGMPGIPNPLRPLPTIIAGSDGRLWFATENGVVWTDPANRPHNSIAPTVVIESLVADGNSLEPTPGLELATNTRNLQISYTALSLSIPERVQFRYRLEGRDTQWQEVGPRRTAYYTDLKPGNYVFRVIACNDDGVWNEIGASLGFQLPPALYQTVWFGLLCLAVLGCLFVLLFFLRLRQIKATLRRRLEQRMEARLEERNRIARDLHDSLLQGFQGMMFNLQAVRRLLPRKPEEAAVSLDAAMDLGDDAIAAGREAVHELRRSNPADSDLTDALVALGDEFAPLSGDLAVPTYRVVVEGQPAELDLTVRDETYRIAREAVRNAFGHAHAHGIEAEIAFGEALFCVRIRDDGIGLDPAILNRGRREGHWGLPGMHERAASFGGELSIWSVQGAGTEIELKIAAKLAYARK